LGFPLGDLLTRVEPTSRAKYVAFTSLFDTEQMPEQRRHLLDWPYVEGLRIDEAVHPLMLLVVGLYGKELPNQNGAPREKMVLSDFSSNAARPSYSRFPQSCSNT